MPLFFDEADDWVHAWVSDDPDGVATSRRRVVELSATNLRQPDGPSCEVRRLWREDAGPILGVAADRLSVGRRGRVPVPCLAGEAIDADLSFSHHGRFVAFVWVRVDLSGRARVGPETDWKAGPPWPTEVGFEL